MTNDYHCPFCCEREFDLIGLKQHFLRGWCDVFNETPATDPPKQQTEKETCEWCSKGVSTDKNGNHWPHGMHADWYQCKAQNRSV